VNGERSNARLAHRLVHAARCDAHVQPWHLREESLGMMPRRQLPQREGGVRLAPGTIDAPRLHRLDAATKRQRERAKASIVRKLPTK